MINSLETYADCGRKTALCRQRRDESGARSFREYFGRMRATEKPEDRPAATAAYNQAYEIEYQ